MKTLSWLKLKFALGFGVTALVAGSLTMAALSQTSKTTAAGLTPAEIAQHSQNAYASLSSYSDDGHVLSTVATNAIPHSFTTKLARPDFYRIGWVENIGSYAQTGMVWSAGNGNFFHMRGMKAPENNSSMKSALSSAAGVSGGATATIPETFFGNGNKLMATIQSAARKPDETINGVDCYVLSKSNNGRTQTVWIGKQDFLIRRIENDISAAAVEAELGALKAKLQAAGQKNPNMQKLSAYVKAGDTKIVETHTNILVNQKFSPSDFEP